MNKIKILRELREILAKNDVMLVTRLNSQGPETVVCATSKGEFVFETSIGVLSVNVIDELLKEAGQAGPYSIDILAKEWWDRVAGNPYFSAEITVDAGQSTEKTFWLPFSYGFGEQCVHESFKLLKTSGILPEFDGRPWGYCRENGISFNWGMKTGCKRAELANPANPRKR